MNVNRGHFKKNWLWVEHTNVDAASKEEEAAEESRETGSTMEDEPVAAETLTYAGVAPATSGGESVSPRAKRRNRRAKEKSQEPAVDLYKGEMTIQTKQI